MVDIGSLGPVLGSIMGSEDRQMAHQSDMQSQSLSAQSAMHKASLANALGIAKMQNSTQRYGIDTNKDIAYRGQDVQRYGIDTGAATQRYGIDVGSETTRRGQDLDQQARRWQNALGYLSMAAQMRGPQDYFQYANFARGAAATDFPSFLADLMGDGGAGPVANAVSSPSFGAVHGQTPAAASLQTLANQMTSGSVGAPNGAPAAAASAAPAAAGAAPAGAAPAGGAPDGTAGLLSSINQIANNMHRLAPGALESLTDTERSLLQSGAEAAGHDWPTLLAKYANSRVMQGSPVAA